MAERFVIKVDIVVFRMIATPVQAAQGPYLLGMDDENVKVY